jgi:hypothetical protein
MGETHGVGSLLLFAKPGCNRAYDSAIAAADVGAGE